MKLALTLLASAALVTPALACPDMDHHSNETKTVEKDKKDAPKPADKAKETPKADTKTDTAKKDQKDQPKDTKDSKDTAKKPDKVSSK